MTKSGMGWRARAAAIVGTCALVATGLTLAATVAHSDPAKVFIGPAAQCPGADWDCTHPTNTAVHQGNGTGSGDFFIKCVTDDCSGPFVQNNGTGNNSIVCDQQAAVADAATQNNTKTCGNSGSSQSSSGGNNTWTINQITTMNTPNPVAGGTNQTGADLGEVSMSTILGGKNTLTVDQTMCMNAFSTIQASATQTMDPRQRLIVHNMTSDANTNSVHAYQTLACGSNPIKQTANVSPNSTQTIATRTTGDPPQYIDLGPDGNTGYSLTPNVNDTGVLSNTGINKVDVNQTQKYTSVARGFGGQSALLVSATQHQGSGPLAPVKFNGRVEESQPLTACADPSAGVTATQNGAWVTDALPSSLNGTLVQTQDDLPGGIRLPGTSPCTFTTHQIKTDQAVGSAPNTTKSETCQEHTEADGKSPGTSTQSCATDSGTATNQATGKHVVIDTNCGPSGCSRTATVNQPSFTAVEGASTTGKVADFNVTGATPTISWVTIDWGDQSSSQATSITNNGNGSYTANGTHQYAEEGSYPLTVTVKDPNNATTNSSATGTATVYDADLHVTGKMIATTTNTVTEQTIATFTDDDPGNYANSITSDYTGTINWGDGSTDNVSGTAGSIQKNANGGFDVIGSHTYAAGTTFPKTVTVTVADQGPYQPGHGPFSGTSTVAKPACASDPNNASAGCFAVGNGGTLTAGTTVQFWGSDWCKKNKLTLASGGCANSSFKGETNSHTPTAGSWWQASGGNSGPPATSVPVGSYMSVIVTSAVCANNTAPGCTGANATGTSGNIVGLIVVKVTSYGPDPSQRGFGVVQ